VKNCLLIDFSPEAAAKGVTIGELQSMPQKTPTVAIILILLLLASCGGCLGGGQTNNQTTSPLANSLLVVKSVQVMIGYNTSLSCVLNTSNGQGLTDQVVYWYLDDKPLGQSSTYFGFSTHNLSVSEVSALSTGEHRIVVEYKGNADYSGSRGSGVLLVVPKPTPTPTPTPTPSPSPRTSTSTATTTPTSSIRTSTTGTR
jgi:hypothetical protein